MSTSIRISGSSDNLFTADLTLAANRTHDLNGNSVTFLKSNFEFRAADALTSTIGFRYRNLANNQNIFSIKNQGRVEINGSDALVLLGGTSYTAYWLTTPTAQMSMFNEGLNQVGFRQNTNNLLFQRGGGNTAETHSSITIANGSWNIGLNWAALTANLNIGMTTPNQARLGVQAANGNGANKTIVVRNHLNTGNILDVRNSGKFAFNTDSISDVDYLFQGTGTSSYGVYVAGSFGYSGVISLVSSTTRHNYYAAWCGFGSAYNAANSGGGATVTGTRIGFSADNFNPSDYQNIGFYGNVTNTGSSNAIQFYANAPNAGDYSFYSQAGENYFRAVDGSGANRTLTVRNHLNTGDLFQILNSGRADFISNAIASAAEEIIRFQVSDSTTQLRVSNGTTADGVFAPSIVSVQNNTNITALGLTGQILDVDDTGTSPINTYTARRTGSAVTTRPLFRWRNFTTNLMDITADGTLAIGTITPNLSALVDITSTTKGFLPPRMTTVQRDAIASPAAGLVVYNSTTNKHQGYNGSTWNDFY